VDVIVGPGNVYVAAAKSVLGNEGRVGVDCLAGPSEIVVLADDTAPSKYVVQDLLSQAEHDADAASVLVTTSPELAQEVWQRLEVLRSQGRLDETTAASMERHGAFLIARDLNEAIGFVNAFGPEHLEIMTRAPERVLTKVRSAGSVFLGSYSPVAAGDYFSGTNHVLPTAGSARFSSGLSVETFTKRLSYQYLSLPALRAMEADIRMLASLEGPFPRHVDSVTIRTGNETESS